MIVCVLIPMIIPQQKQHQEKIIEYIYIKDHPKKAKQNKKSKIKLECVESLVSLGMKKKDAEIKVDEMFCIKQYNSVENFIVDAYSR